MEHKIISQTKNPLLGREEFLMELVAEKNPSKTEIVALLKKDESLCVVRKIVGSFGSGTFSVDAIVYDSKEAKDNIERPNRKARKKAADEAKKAAEAAKLAGGAK